MAIRCWLLAVLLWLLNLAFGAAFAGATGYWLQHVLAGSLATRTLLYDLDPNIFVDLYRRHDSGFAMLLGVACFMGAAYVGLWCWLHGIVIFTTCSKRRVRLTDTLLPAFGVFPRMLRLLLVAAWALALLSVVCGGLAFLVSQAAERCSVGIPREWAAALAGVVWLVGYIFLVAVHDHARIRLCAQGEGAIEAYRWAFGFVTHGGERAFLLAVCLQVTAFMVWAAFQAVGMWMHPHAELGTVGVLLWAELVLLARMLVRLWFFAAQGDLQCAA